MDRRLGSALTINPSAVKAHSEQLILLRRHCRCFDSLSLRLYMSLDVDFPTWAEALALLRSLVL